jgi:hypothetical protein
MQVSLWLLFTVNAIALAIGYVAGIIRASAKYSALLDQATKEIKANSAANRELFATLKRKGIH